MALKYSLKDKAFSLLELIMALAILSIGMVAVLQAFSFSAQVTGLSCDIISAVFLAEDKMQELEFQETQGSLQEAFERGESGRFIWERSIVQEQDLDMFKADLKISWQRQGRQQALEASTYLRK